MLANLNYKHLIQMIRRELCILNTFFLFSYFNSSKQVGSKVIFLSLSLFFFLVQKQKSVGFLLFFLHSIFFHSFLFLSFSCRIQPVLKCPVGLLMLDYVRFEFWSFFCWPKKKVSSYINRFSMVHN